MKRNREALYNPEKYQLVGVTANPKLGAPCLTLCNIESVSGKTAIYRPDGGKWSYEGAGYFDSDEDNKNVRLTGFPRSHTPGGVETKGAGFGTCLYTSMCLVGHLHHEDDLPSSFNIPGDGDGCGSAVNDRSHSAEAWWEKAVERGIVEREDHEGEIEQYDVSLEDYGVDSYSLDQIVHDGVSVERVNCMDADITTYEQAELDTYRYDSAAQSGLAVLTFHARNDDEPINIPALAALDAKRPEAVDYEELTRHVQEVNDDALLALNMMGCPEWFVWFIMGVGREHEVDQTALEQMMVRWRAQVDPDIDDQAWGIAGSGYTPNDAEVRKALEAAEKHRERLGWEKLASLP